MAIEMVDLSVAMLVYQRVRSFFTWGKSQRTAGDLERYSGPSMAQWMFTAGYINNAETLRSRGCNGKIPFT